MTGFPAFCRPTGDGIAVFVRLTPKSSRDAIEGAAGSADGRCHLKARVRAVPENGKANRALEQVLAKELNVPAGTVSVTGGATARLKTVQVLCEASSLLERLKELAKRGS